MNKEGMMTTMYIVYLNQPPRLGTWVVPPQQQMQRSGAILHNTSLPELTSHCMPGSSQASCSTIGTTPRCNITIEGDTGTPYTSSLPPSPTTAVELQHSASEGREMGAEEPSFEPRQPRRAALHQHEFLRSLIDDFFI